MTTTTACEHVLNKLRDHGSLVNESGDGRATAQCPAHDDGRPSLSVTRIEGSVLVHCHAGCQVVDVLDAVGLTPRDLFDDPRGASYKYPDGRTVLRTPDKRFSQRGNTKGRTLFHSDRIGDAQVVYAVEGEKDVLAVEAVGAAAVCSAMGAGKARQFDWSTLNGKHVIVVADRDEPGRKHAAEVADLLGGRATSVRIVEAAVGKDAADHLAAGKTLDEFVMVDSGTPSGGDDETVKTVPWPTLSDAALHGTPGEIVNLVAPHTEADPAAILVQLLAVFGATLGPGPHIVAGNERHRTVIAPLIIGRTNNGAKGTGLGVVEAIRKLALPWFDEFTTSGLSSAEGLIELVRDPSGDPGDKDYDAGVSDKRLLVKESEYRSVLARCRREGNTLSMTLRQAWDGGTLRTLARKHNKLTATDPHIVVIGHITPREFRSTLDDSDLSGGSINRLLICLSRRSRLNARLGNIPHDVLTRAADLFAKAQKEAQNRGEMKFTDAFWSSWETTYRELNRDRPDSWATDATARGVTQVLRLALIYALFDGAAEIDTSHLDAALALWAYAEHSAKWLFSTHDLEIEREAAGGLANFIREGGCDGRTRTEIYRDYFKSNIKAAEITAELTPLVHDGVVTEIRDETGGRPTTRYVHRNLRIDVITDYAGQEADQDTYSTDYVRIDSAVRPVGPEVNASEYVADTSAEKPPDLQNPSNTLIRKPIEQSGARTLCPECERAPARSDTGICDLCTVKAQAGGQR
ncbi:MAG: hypothetical protein QOH91_1607 [Mycobacterium sp.]|nr:hypothetical protein [Mycobacterium sp.]